MATSSRSSSLALLFVVVAYTAAGAFAATSHEVGDDKRWTIPQSPTTYTDWANKQTFAVGDSLVFNFPTGAHDVLQVTKSNYDACNNQSPIETFNTGPATVTLPSSGTFYYICGIGTHCSLGQKMTLTVSAASSPTTPSPPPTSGGPTTPTPSTPAVPSSPGPSGAGTPPNAAPSNGPGLAATVAVAVTASAAALLLL